MDLVKSSWESINSETRVVQWRVCDVQIRICGDFYGSNLLNFDPLRMESLYSAWRSCSRRVLGLNPRAHCSLLPHITRDPPLSVKLHRTFVNFLQKALRSCNRLVSRTAHISLSNYPNSVTRNVSMICARYGIMRSDIECGTSVKRELFSDPDCNDPTDVANGSLVRDLLELYTSDRDDMRNFRDIIEHVCLE